MAATTKIFQLRPTPLPIAATHTHTPTPASVHFFSSSSSSSSSSSTPDSNSNPTSEPPPQSQSQSSFSAFFSDVKATLKQSEQQRSPQSQQPPRNTFSIGSSLRNQPTFPRNHADAEKLRRNLAEFRRRTVPPPPNALGSISAPPNSPEPISIAKLYNNHSERFKGKGPIPDEPSPPFLSLRDIRDSLSKIKPQNQNDKNLILNEHISPSYTPDQYRKPSSTVIGGSGTLPAAVFGPEIRAKEDGDGSAKEKKWEFVKMYSAKELGEKLRSLRPEKKGDNKDWFSLEELNQRLVKLREMEERQRGSRQHLGFDLDVLRQGLEHMDATKKSQGKFGAVFHEWIL